MRCKWLLGPGSLLGLMLAWGTPSDRAGAATATTTFQVVANVLSTCTIVATEMNFGDYTGLKINAQSSLIVKCTNTAQWNIGLDKGTCGADVTTRCMNGPSGHILNYSLFSDGAGTINWGNTLGTDTVAGTGTGTAQVVTVFGALPAGQTVAGPGGYVDTITATITF